MTLSRQRIILGAFLMGVSVTLAHALARAQSPTSAVRNSAIQLTSQKITLPFGRRVFAGGEAAKLANSRCLLCHSKDMIDAQPPLALETWKKEVDKMRTAYGCPLRAEQTDSIAKFISQASRAPAYGGD